MLKRTAKEVGLAIEVYPTYDLEYVVFRGRCPYNPITHKNQALFALISVLGQVLDCSLDITFSDGLGLSKMEATRKKAQTVINFAEKNEINDREKLYVEALKHLLKGYACVEYPLYCGHYILRIPVRLISIKFAIFYTAMNPLW